VKALCEYGDEVARAVDAKAPLVALETTVVTHGLPHPEGVTTALWNRLYARRRREDTEGKSYR
jgi:pseudouridine-5'-phosphate glycosidase